MSQSTDAAVASISLMSGDEPVTSNDEKDTRYLLLQVRSELAAHERAQLEQLGVEVLQFVPDDTYLCRFDVGELTRVRALAFVTWANPFMKPRKAARAI
jgi:serine protease AprX